MLWPNPTVTLLSACIRKPLIRRHQKVVKTAFEEARLNSSFRKEGPISTKEAVELAHLEFIRLLLDHTEFAERYLQIAILYAYAFLGFTGLHENQIIRARPWQA